MSRSTASHTGAPDDAPPVLPSPDGVPAAEHLLGLVHALDSGCDREPAPELPQLVRVIEGDDDRNELGLLSLDGDHPLSALLGLDAPAGWTILGTMARGNLHAIPPGDCRRGSPPFRVMRDPAAARRRARIIHLVHRSGHSVSLVRGADDEPFVDQCGPGDASRGLLDDACRRALGLPTAPPTQSPQAMWVGLWLDHVLAACLGGAERAPRSWSDLVRLHPIWACLAGEELAWRLGRAELVTATEIMGRRWSWRKLRVASAEGQFGSTFVEPELAEWMDAGMFSRWVLQQLPDADQAVECLREHAPESLADEVAELLAGWT